MSVPLEDLIKKWAMVDKMHSEVVAWRSCAPLFNRDYGIELVKHAIHMELFIMTEKHEVVDSLDLWENPHRVKVNKKITANKLVLVPSTRQVGHRDRDNGRWR